MLVAVAALVAVAQRHALRGEEGAQERRHVEDLVADQLEQPADLPLGHRAEPEPGHVDEGSQVRRHDQVGPGRIRENEPGILGRNAGLDQVAVDAHRAADRVFVLLANGWIGILDRGGQHRRRALVRDVALALLVEGDTRPMTNQLMRQGP